MSGAIRNGGKLKSMQVSVTGTPALLVAAPADGLSRANGGMVIKALSANTQTVWLGGSDVTTSTGYPLAAGESVSVPLGDQSKCWGVSTSGTQTLAILYI